jgi:hypothetical protein
MSSEPPAVRRWSSADLALGSALIVLIVALFLPWFSETVRLGSSFRFTSLTAADIRGTADGPRVHSYLWLVLVLAIIGLAVLAGRDAISRSASNLPSPRQMLIGATGLALALSVLGFASKPWSSLPSILGQLGSRVQVSIGWDYGGIVAIIAAAIALLLAVVNTGPLGQTSHAARASGPVIG